MAGLQRLPLHGQDELVAAKRAAFVLGGTVRGISPAPVPGRED